MTTKNPAKVADTVPSSTPAKAAENMRAWLGDLSAQTRFWEALEATRSLPIAALLDELALKDLVALQMWVPAASANDHAQQVWECIENTTSASTAMKANYWLRRAMVYSKDFMLWDDSMLGEQVRAARRKGGKSKPAKLPSADILLAELHAMQAASRDLSEKDAKSKLRNKYKVTSQGLNRKLKKAKAT